MSRRVFISQFSRVAGSRLLRHAEMESLERCIHNDYCTNSHSCCQDYDNCKKAEEYDFLLQEARR